MPDPDLHVLTNTSSFTPEHNIQRITRMQLLRSIKIPVLSRTHLKLIACLTMLIDHLCFVFFSGSADAINFRLTIGRIAFPLFTFMICEGFYYTRSRLRYCLQILLLFVATEYIYDMAFYHRIYWKNQSVLLTLLLALLMYCAMEKCKKYLILQLLICAGFAAAAHYLHADYGHWGIIMCTALYFCRKIQLPDYVSVAISIIALIAGYGTYGAFLAVIFVFFYDNTRGHIGTAGKYLFYVFYPAHLLILRLIYLAVH